jgi:membrane associated rhomboid family serine protease
MFSLYLFGGRLEYDPEPGRVDFMDLFGDNGKIYYLLMYILALFVCLLPTFVRHKNNYNYRSLGASGAVSAVIFASIILHPLDRLGFYFIPPVIPAYIFGALYLIISTYMGKRSRDNINHSAHIWGALFGIAYLVVLAYILHTDYKPLQEFIEKIKGSLGIN